MKNMEFVIVPRRFLIGLLSFIGLLLLANIIGLYSTYGLGHDYVFGLVPLFDFNGEKNVPAFYSAVALLVASLLLFSVSSLNKKSDEGYYGWTLLAVIFAFLSLDEIASIHERLIAPVRETLDVNGVLFFAWVIPYGAALVVFVASYSKFLWKLPTNIRNLFIISGAMFVTGAIGFELLEGRQVELYGYHNFLFSIFYTCEELLEMVSIAIFIYTLLLHISTRFGTISIRTMK